MLELRKYIRHLIIEGAKDRYLKMFDDPMFAPYFSEDGRISDIIDWARENLKKDNAIVWYLRWVRIRYYFQALKDKILKEKGSRAIDELGNHGIASSDKKMMKIIKQAVPNEQETNINVILEKAYRMATRTFEMSFEHYLSLDLDQINNYDYERKDPYKVLRDFSIIEEEWKKKYDGLIPINQDDQVIMEFDGGQKAWVYLDQWKCDKESKAMGHCGNAAGSTTDRILSFRSRVEGPNGKPMWRPHLTFILDTTTFELGEMKGRGNDKPSEKYHPYIVALLEAPKFKVITNNVTDNGEMEFSIKGLKGGGYKPENNFSLSDLPQEIQDQIIEKKPEFATLAYQYQKFGMTPELIKKVEHELRNTGLPQASVVKYLKEKSGFILNTSKSAKDVVHFLRGWIFTTKFFDVAEWAAEIVDGESHLSHLEVYYDHNAISDYEVRDLYDALPPDILNKLNASLIHRKDEEIEDDDPFDLLINYDNEVERIFKDAILSGVEQGKNDAVYINFMRWLEDLNVYNNEDGHYEYILPEGDAVDIADRLKTDDGYYDNVFAEYYDDEDVRDFREPDDDYNKEAAIETLIDSLQTEEII